jgi:aromatic ring-opening dioxygenase catalytic subunit (LigB family)
MGQIVWAAATAHTGAMIRAPAGGDAEDAARAQRVFDAFHTLGESLKAASPDVLVVIATDHFLTFEYAALPIFAIGTGDRFAGWGEFGVPRRDYRGLAPFGARVHEGMVAAGFDAVSARDMKVDHSFSCPLQLLLRDWDVPILPIYVNCTIEPLPSHQRCLEFGTALGEVVWAQTDARRVALLGTGGLSHSVGTPRTGIINTEFDRRFLDLFGAGRFDQIARWSSQEVIDSAGNGAAEIRNWLLAAAAARASGARVLAYEPVQTWATGIAVTELVA